MNEIKPKRTWYKDVFFRSRLEAKWAIFFDELGIKWQYEPEYDVVEFGIGRVYYKPDFYLPAYDLWVEIKPQSIRSVSDGDKYRRGNQGDDGFGKCECNK